MSLRPLGRAAVLLPMMLLGCGGPGGPEHSGDPNLDARVRVSPTPAAVGPARVSVQASEEGQPLAGVRVRLRIHPARDAADGEWTPVEATTTVGTYGPVEVGFPTEGDWVVEVEVTLDGGRSARVRHPIAVVSATATGRSGG